MKHFTVRLALLLALTACSKHSEEEFAPQPVSHFDRVVMVYMSGDNDLSDDATNDLQEIKEGMKTIGANNKMLVFMDHMSERRPYILDVGANGCDTVEVFDHEFYASDPKNFHNIIASLAERYPAEEYGLVLWGHASGWLIERDTIASQQTAAPQARRAYGYDNRGEDASATLARWMNITQMGHAMQGLPHFRFILADCCCMLCAETAYELRKATDYLIGSPAEIPGYGAPYQLIVPELFSSRDSFYCDIIDKYYDYYLEQYQTSAYTNYSSTSYLAGYSLPMAVVDMQYMDDLADATRDALSLQQVYTVDRLPYYYESHLPVMYDMGCVMQRNVSAEVYEEWRKALRKAVPYRRFSARWMSRYNSITRKMRADEFADCGDAYAGLSMFVPLSLYDQAANCDYNEKIRNTQWFWAVEWDRSDQ